MSDPIDPNVVAIDVLVRRCHKLQLELDQSRARHKDCMASYEKKRQEVYELKALLGAPTVSAVPNASAVAPVLNLPYLTPEEAIKEGYEHYCGMCGTITGVKIGGTFTHEVYCRNCGNRHLLPLSEAKPGNFIKM